MGIDTKLAIDTIQQGRKIAIVRRLALCGRCGNYIWVDKRLKLPAAVKCSVCYQWALDSFALSHKEALSVAYPTRRL